MKSIRRYLNITLAIVLFVIIGLAVTAAYYITRHEMEEIFDAQLSVQARIVASLVGVHTSSDEYAMIARQLSQPGHFARWFDPSHRFTLNPDNSNLYDDEERVLSMGFWDAMGRPILMGARWNEPDRAFPAPDKTGHRSQSYDGNLWRVFSLHLKDGRWVSIGLRETFQSELSNKIAMGNLAPLLFALPILFWLIAHFVRRGLNPIDQLSRQVEARDEKDLSTIHMWVPRELEALHRALNDFISRLASTLERERRFTADAAHEMRTPLAAMKIHLDNARHGETSSLDKAYQGVERLQRVVEQLLLLARLDISDERPAREKVNLSGLILELVADIWPQAEASHQVIDVGDDGSVWVLSNRTELGILIRNLLDNALRYTPVGGEVAVNWGGETGFAWVVIEDSGPGIPDDMLDLVKQRFQRNANQHISGSGLGLAIVVEIAERQRITLTLENRPVGGLSARLDWHDPSI
ncbi:MAG: sensor histidine kinase [Salinicola sp.]|uniref:ATP-binding protein n=1 Tax=Salinicola sp. TaxID=1978524 RepID=UPI001D8140B0|nr:ATP-binding protein [Salinicola sp.]NRB55011.1 sensor histidine kinase [Salinicola sp.]